MVFIHQFCPSFAMATVIHQAAVAADHQVRLLDVDGGPVHDLRLCRDARILEDQIAHGTWTRRARTARAQVKKAGKVC